jgi:hypothetical protein
MTRYWGDESWRQVAYEARESYGMKYEVKRHTVTCPRPSGGA